MFNDRSICKALPKHTAEASDTQGCIEFLSPYIAAITWNVAMVCKGIDERAGTTKVCLGRWMIIAFLKRRIVFMASEIRFHVVCLIWEALGKSMERLSISLKLDEVDKSP